MMIKYFRILLLLLSGSLLAQSNLQSGPMVGYSTMKEVLLWVQTNTKSKVYFEYWEKSNSKEKYYTDTVFTQSENAFIAKNLAIVSPGKHYEYALYLNDTKQKIDYQLEFQSQPLWHYRTDPPEFTFATGSCLYINEPEVDRPGRAYGGEYSILNEIYKKNPDFMLWLGDNTYLREVDYDSKTGIYHRHTHTRSIKELQPLLGNTHHYAIWDDHDYGPNDSDRSYPLKKLTEKAFNDFWGNQITNITGEGGVTSFFVWNDCLFLLLDNRFFRSPRSDSGTVLGEKQYQWLIDMLSYSRAAFKFIAIGGQVVNDVATYENYAVFKQEREKLLNDVMKSKARGVIFLTGDRHHTELSVIDSLDYPLYDLTVSPLTSSAHDASNEKNSFREDGTFVSERNFGLLNVSGERKNRKLKIQIYNQSGELKWEKEISAKDLKKK